MPLKEGSFFLADYFTNYHFMYDYQSLQFMLTIIFRLYSIKYNPVQQRYLHVTL